jgi:O-antigen/teichoic acid export membrane protein
MMAWNAASQVGALAVAVVLHTFYSIVIARILGPEVFGVYAFI